MKYLRVGRLMASLLCFYFRTMSDPTPPPKPHGDLARLFIPHWSEEDQAVAQIYPGRSPGPLQRGGWVSPGLPGRYISTC